jgi:hypothetical protein
MNDAAEATFGWQRIEQFLRSKNPQSNEEKRAIGVALEQIGDFRNMLADENSYIACFSKHGDSLSQWRAYGFGGGFSLGFSRDALTALANSPKSKVRDVVYKSVQQDRLLEVAYDRALNLKLEDQKVQLAAGLLFVALAARTALPWLKHPAFQEEAEVRLHVFRQRSYQATHFRISAMGLTPYVPISICEPDKSITAIREIVIGPQRHPVEVMRAIKGLLGKNKLDIRVRQSAVPLRL